MHIKAQTAAFAYTNESIQGTVLDKGNEMGKQDFLLLLVTELRNQDPMNPVKNEDMAANLAQFSQLEELTNIREATEGNTKTLDGVITSVNAMISTSMLGKVARSAPSLLELMPDEDVSIPIQLLGDAASVEIRIIDNNGDTIRTITRNNLNEGMHFVSWDGTGDYGMRYAPGGYRFQVTARAGDGTAVSVNPYIEGTVESLSFENGRVYFVIDGVKVPFTHITEINEPNSNETNHDDQIGG